MVYNGGMGMEAIAAYLRTLRKGSALTQNDVALALGVDDLTVRRWEQAKSEPLGLTLVALIKLIKGSLQHLEVLADATTAAAGEELAHDWLKRIEAQAREDAKLMTDDELKAAIAALDKIRDSPDLINRVTAYIEGLVEGHAARRNRRSIPPALRRRRRDNGHKL
jgi:transcriptional regulator with XRE-family HTH domain